jgi:hypothetical protein
MGAGGGGFGPPRYIVKKCPARFMILSFALKILTLSEFLTKHGFKRISRQGFAQQSG